MSKASQKAVDSLVALIEKKRLEAVSVFIKTECGFERQNAKRFCETCCKLRIELEGLHSRINLIESGL